MEIPVFSIVINPDNADNSGVNLVSFVSDPAIEENFVKLKAEEELAFVQLNEEKRILTGPALIPNKQILRISPEGLPYFIVFSAEVIEQIRDKFHRLKFTDATNDEHETELNGNYLIESWIIKDADKDKAAAVGLSSLPVGTWVTSYKVPSEKYWNEKIKSGDRVGFSIEGFFSMEPIKKELSKLNNNNIMNKTTKLSQFINALQGVFSQFLDKPAEAVKFEGEGCTDCDKKEGLGAEGGAWLSARVDEMTTETLTRGDIIENVARAAGVEPGTINQIIAGEINCPPLDRLQAFAEVMGVEVETVVSQFRGDGCSYDLTPEEAAKDETPAEANPAGDLEKVEQKTEDPAKGWADLEALAKIDELTASLKFVKEENTNLINLIAELKTENEKLNSAPAAPSINTDPTPKVKTEKDNYIERLKAMSDQLK